MSKKEKQLRKALERSRVALGDWVHQYAPELCKDDAVRTSNRRVCQAGGILAYIADVQRQNREALKDE